MNHKKILIGMMAAGLTIPTLVAADWTIYGRANVSADFLDDGNDFSELDLVSRSSRLGFKGEREWSDQLVGIFQVEQQIDFDSSEGETFTTRDTFVGFKGSDWGMLRVGRFDTPFKKARGAVNYFGDQVGDIRNILRTRQHGRFDQRFRNSIHYRTPSFSGVTWDVQYSTDRGQQDTRADADDGFSTALNFKQGGFSGAIAYEQQNNEATEDVDAVRLALAYKLTPTLEIGALYQNTEAPEGDEADAYGVAAQYQFAPNWYVRGQGFVLDSDADDSDATLFAVGIERRIDKDLRIRVNFGSMDNDDNSALTPWSQGGGPGEGDATGETATALQLGIRYDF